MSDDDLTRVFAALHPEVTIERTETGATVGRAVFHPQPEHRGNPGFLHGGMAATVLDHVCARTGGAALGERVVTGTLSLRYPHPVVIDDGPFGLWAEARHPRGRMVRVRGAIIGPAALHLVEADGLFVTRPGSRPAPS